MVESRTIGIIWCTSIVLFWIYYTVWIIISPSIDTNHSIQKYFPERKWGIVIPILLGLGFLSIALTMIGVALINDSKIYDAATRKIEEKN
jgi:dolichyl-phosphate mannosyltransferase polypeptide 2 regulatory subunit